MQELFENLRSEFSSEVELLAKIEHQNLVKLLGYIDKGNERLIITEYVPNGTLREHLDGKDNPPCTSHESTHKRLPKFIMPTGMIVSRILIAGQHGKFLDFNQRLGIAIDIAHGLTHLHLYAGLRNWLFKILWG